VGAGLGLGAGTGTGPGVGAADGVPPEPPPQADNHTSASSVAAVCNRPDADAAGRTVAVFIDTGSMAVDFQNRVATPS
jgi:hypothetical protein